MFSVKILADSVSLDQVRLTTVEATMPRIILSEFNTHRMFSRNSASSRAIPINKKIQYILDDPFIPEAFGANKSGMQAGQDIEDQETAKALWFLARDNAISAARKFQEIGVHKQWANRLLEPFSWQTVIVSATEWSNFFALRCHPDAQPEIRKIAEMIRAEMENNQPKFMDYGHWHLPLVFDEDVAEAKSNHKEKQKVDLFLTKLSVARCARVSYLTHDGKRELQADFDLYDRLLKSGHLSPFEHVATPERPRYWAGNQDIQSFGNFFGWKQHRKFIGGENDYFLLKDKL